MSQAFSRVVHQVPGRVRMEISLLRNHPAYEQAVQKLVQSLDAVTGVRINSSARALVVNYDAQVVTEVAFNQQLLAALQSVQPAETPAPQTLAAFEATDLTPYEAAQFAAIQQWQQQQISRFTWLLGWGFTLLKGLLSVIVPGVVFEKIGAACEAATANWQQDWQELRELAEVEDYQMLRQGSLNTCDALAHHVTDRALAETTADGGISGLFDWFGEIVDDGLTLVLALKTIHRIGLCYGYAPETLQEQTFAWEILNISVAQTPAERQAALDALHCLRLQLGPQQSEQETLQDSLEEEVHSMLLSSVIEQELAELGEETAAGVVPVLSLFLSIWADRSMMEAVSTAAQHEFQLRWLYDHQKARLKSTPGDQRDDCDPSTPTQNSPEANAGVSVSLLDL